MVEVSRPTSRWEGEDETVFLAQLRDIVSHPAVVEVLECLAAGPVRFFAVVQILGKSPIAVARALRVLDAAGVVERETPIQLTSFGFTVASQLQRFATWDALYAGGVDEL
ncbi:hypothetical protein FOS14_14905 [Skermania sp. ID1734]|uniref:hypothetical protein n=1 Tax=Skermania sp. ID1734 TaxID=2597516 RepID=UPI001180A4AA|nr:hypothetical protein [Skermania sp. ID1734]TSD97274.1 hypothetical protein FOS14_14905 [Skermania sp. ID1734]